MLRISQERRGEILLFLSHFVCAKKKPCWEMTHVKSLRFTCFGCCTAFLLLIGYLEDVKSLKLANPFPSTSEEGYNRKCSSSAKKTTREQSEEKGEGGKGKRDFRRRNKGGTSSSSVPACVGFKDTGGKGGLSSCEIGGEKDTFPRRRKIA